MLSWFAIQLWNRGLWVGLLTIGAIGVRVVAAIVEGISPATTGALADRAAIATSASRLSGASALIAATVLALISSPASPVAAPLLAMASLLSLDALLIAYRQQKRVYGYNALEFAEMVAYAREQPPNASGGARVFVDDPDSERSLGTLPAGLATR